MTTVANRELDPWAAVYEEQGISRVLPNNSLEDFGTNPSKINDVEVPQSSNVQFDNLAALTEDAKIELAMKRGTSPQVLAVLDCPLKAGNISTPSGALARLASCDDDNVRFVLAGNTNTPPSILALLADDNYEAVHVALAYNPSTPPLTLERLASHDNSYVRARIPQNLAATPNILLRLARDTNENVRLMVAINPNTPVEASSWLPETEFLKNPTEHILRSDDVFRRESVARNPFTPPQILAKLAEDPNPKVRAALAGNAAAPIDLLKTLSSDPDPAVYMELVYNRAVPAALADGMIDKLAIDPAASRYDVADKAPRPKLGCGAALVLFLIVGTVLGLIIMAFQGDVGGILDFADGVWYFVGLGVVIWAIAKVIGFIRRA